MLSNVRRVIPRSPRWTLLAAATLSCSATALALVACGSFLDAAVEPADASPSADEGGPCNGIADCERFVFVTSDTYTGEDIGGAIAGDGKCTNRAALVQASAVLRGRKFRAWLSDDIDNTQPVNRMTHGTRPYRLEDGTLIANDWNQLTTAFGTRTPQTCTSWTIGGAVMDGTIGRPTMTDSTWTNTGIAGCGLGQHLYCIEQ
jgi:hypothetical protein